jgi:hypothetical protein
MTLWQKLDKPDYGTRDPPTYDQKEYARNRVTDGNACGGIMVCNCCGSALTCDTYTWHQRLINSLSIGDNMDLGQHYDKDSTKGSKKFKQRPFLKAKDIPAKGCTAKIIEFREAPKSAEYSDFFMDLSIGKKEYVWGLKSKSVTLNMLIDELGKRTEKWTGKTVKLVRGGSKSQYVNVG